MDWEPGTPHWYGYSLYSFEVYGTPAQNVPPAGAGEVEVLEEFSAGVPADYFSWSSTPGLKPALSTVVDDSVSSVRGGQLRPGRRRWRGMSAGRTTSGSRTTRMPQDWSEWDGFQFWFLGSGSGRSLSFELKNGGQLFDRTVVDDAAGMAPGLRAVRGPSGQG